jgi:hypothetical protein
MTRSHGHSFSHDLGTAPTPGGAKEHLGLVVVVRTAAKLDVVDRGPAARRVRAEMMKLDEGPFAAPPAVSADEHAAPAIADECRPLHLGRDMS